MIRLVATVSNTKSCKIYFNELKIKTHSCINIYGILVHMKMSLNRFRTKSDLILVLYEWIIHTIQGISQTYFFTGHNTKLFGQSFTHNGLFIFNKLSSENKHIEPIKKFKKILYNFLIEKCLYSVEEFMTMDSQLVIRITMIWSDASQTQQNLLWCQESDEWQHVPAFPPN